MIENNKDVKKMKILKELFKKYWIKEGKYDNKMLTYRYDSRTEKKIQKGFKKLKTENLVLFM